MPPKEPAARSVRAAFVGVAVDVAAGYVCDGLGELGTLYGLIAFHGRVFGGGALLGQAPGQSSEFTHLHTSLLSRSGADSCAVD